MYHKEVKTIEFIQCLITFGETSQGRPNYVLKWRRHSDVNFKRNIKHITVVFFLALLTKCVARNTFKLAVAYS